jgi:hypothetical protein
MTAMEQDILRLERAKLSMDQETSALPFFTVGDACYASNPAQEEEEL